MVLQKVVEEGHLEVSDTLIDDNNTAIRVRCEDRRQCVCVCMFMFWSDRSEMLFFHITHPLTKTSIHIFHHRGLFLQNLHKNVVVMVTFTQAIEDCFIYFFCVIHHHVQVDFCMGPAHLC